MNKKTFEYRGVKVDINVDALNSFRVQKAIAQMETKVGAGFDALDVVFCDKLDDVIMEVPDEDGNKYEYGAPSEVVADLITCAMNEVQDAKKA